MGTRRRWPPSPSTQAITEARTSRQRRTSASPRWARRARTWRSTSPPTPRRAGSTWSTGSSIPWAGDPDLPGPLLEFLRRQRRRPAERWPRTASSLSWLTAASMAFQDAGDPERHGLHRVGRHRGAIEDAGDGKAHVQYPASDPWVLSVGGTSIGSVSGTSFTEYAWNDDTGASGGGVSYFFARPSYPGRGRRARVGQPRSSRRPRESRTSRATPAPTPATPASTWAAARRSATAPAASSPLWAGLIAVINAALGEPVGFLNPQLYELGSSVCRDIVPLPQGPATTASPGDDGLPRRHRLGCVHGLGQPQRRSAP